jgi:GNAT superfamily N-acetyltransferase
MAVLDLADPPRVEVPDGYAVTSFAEGVDLARLNRCLHRGFNHPEPVPTDADTMFWRRRSATAPSLIPELNTIVVAPDGEYASYCGIFFDPATDYLLVEPVCTRPADRRRGCGSAAVLTAVARAAALGARRAFVGSDQQFYYDLGFVPYHRSRWWRRDLA